MNVAPTPVLEELISADAIARRTAQLGKQIMEDYGNEPLVVVGILKGSFLFLADLVRHLGAEVTVDFVQVSSYGTEKSSSGVVQIRKDLDVSIEGKHVLLVEDIVDTGMTLAHLRQLLGVRNPRSLKVASLLSKPDARKLDTTVEYIGFDIPNEFVVGYGLDYAERFRNLPYIAILR